MTPLNHLKMQPIEKDFDTFCGVSAEDQNVFLLDDSTDDTDCEVNTQDNAWEDVLVEES